MSGVARVADQPKSKEPQSQGNAAGLTAINSDLLRNVKVSLEACLGNAAMTVEEMMALKPGSVVTLETGLADHVELYLNDKLIARGEIVAVGEQYGVRIVDTAPK
jgi:flagellar motor switch protein FliN/FliY